jgi:predicted deacylase
LKQAAGLHFKSVAYTGLKPGPRVIILGAVHGNETCGTQAIQRVLAEIDGGQLHIAAGSVTFVPVANPLAYARGERAGERNLNRNLYPNAQPDDFEDQIANWLCPLLAQHEVLLDLHSFHTAGDPFVMLGPENNSGTLEPFAHAAEEVALARSLGVRRFVDGWLDTYARGVERRMRSAAGQAVLNADPRYGVGTTEYMRTVGGYGLTLECGQHQAPEAPEVAYQAIHNALAFLGVTEQAKPEPVTDTEALHLFDVIDKDHAADTFVREWASFDRISQGELIGTRHDGTPVTAECDSFILFPNPRAGAREEWFYLARASQRV